MRKSTGALMLYVSRMDSVQCKLVFAMYFLVFTKASRQARQSCFRERSEYRGCGGELDEVAGKTTVAW